MAVHQIKNLLKKSLRRAGISEKVDAVRIIERFKRVIQDKWGKQSLDRISVKYLKNSVLTVYVKDSVYLAELKLKEAEIIKKVNENEQSVKRLRMVVN